MQIAEGVRLSQDKFMELGGSVCPSGFQQVSGDIPFGKEHPLSGVATMLCNVQFEVSLTSDTSNNTGGGIAVLFGAFSVGGKSHEESKEVSLNRVRFNIPVSLPAQKP